MEMEYGYGACSYNLKGFQFGVWEFVANHTQDVMNRGKYVLDRHGPPTTWLGGESENIRSPILGILENLRWAGGEDEVRFVLCLLIQGVFLFSAHHLIPFV